MKKIILSAILLATTSFYAQDGKVGVGNTDPKASLDVTGTPATATVADGIIAPRLTGDQLAAKDAVYIADQTAAQVYVTAAATTPAGKTVNVTAPGYYYYDGAVWQKVATGKTKFVDGTTATNAVYTDGSVAVGIVNPVPSAALDVTSTTKGFLPPRMTKVQMDAIVTPAEGLIVYCTNCFPKGVFVNNGSTFVSMVNNTPNIPAGVTLAADEVYSITGKIWKDRNLGASQVATSSTDFNGYGNLYQWGRANDGHQVIVHTAATLPNGTAPAAGSSSSAAGPVAAGAAGANFITVSATPFDWLTVQDDTRWQTAAGVNNPCPSGFRIPTETEFNNERLAFTSNNAAGAYASLLKLPVAGYRLFSNGTLSDVGSSGNYWSSTVSGTRARRLYFSSSNAAMGNNLRANGFSVRCIKD
jgi:uncharacterized protein (TIGR02145 family)